MSKQVKITVILDQPLQGEYTEQVTRAILGDRMAYGRYPSFSQDRVTVEEIDTETVMHHTANVRGADRGQSKVLRGEFYVLDGKLSFTCMTRNVEFEEVLAGLTLLRDELQRQIDNQQLCPFHPANKKEVK